MALAFRSQTRVFRESFRLNLSEVKSARATTLINIPCCAFIESMKKQSISSSKSPKTQEKKRFTADMIGKPQDDLRHTGHIGYDGIAFGDISFIGSDPVEKILPIKGPSSGNGAPNSHR